SACDKAGINRGTFRTTALRLGVADQYAKALSALAHAQAEALEQAIDDMRSGVIDAQMARVEIDARQWFASKFLPKQYGDRGTTELTGANGGPVETVSWTAQADDDLLKRVASLKGGSGG